MIMTFDFALIAQRDDKLMQAINDAMTSRKLVVELDIKKLMLSSFLQKWILELIEYGFAKAKEMVVLTILFMNV